MRRVDFFLSCWLLVGVFLFLFLLATSRAQTNESATATIEIKQGLSLGCQAFRAHMRMDNDLVNPSLKAGLVAIPVSDSAKDPIQISSNPGSKNTHHSSPIALKSQEDTA